MQLTLVLNPNPQCHLMTCSICGSDFRSPVVPTLEGSGSQHHVCAHCVFLTQEEMPAMAKKFRNFLDCWHHVQSKLCTWLEHAKIEDRPSKEDIDVAAFEAQWKVAKMKMSRWESHEHVDRGTPGDTPDWGIRVSVTSTVFIWTTKPRICALGTRHDQTH